MNLSIDTTDPDVAALFKDCEPGEQKTLTFTVEAKTPEGVTGSIDTVEGYDEPGEEMASGEEDAPADKMPHKGGRKMGKSLTIILGGK